MASGESEAGQTLTLAPLGPWTATARKRPLRKPVRQGNKNRPSLSEPGSEA
jgi:hypothetical protein